MHLAFYHRTNVVNHASHENFVGHDGMRRYYGEVMPNNSDPHTVTPEIRSAELLRYFTSLEQSRDRSRDGNVFHRRQAKQYNGTINASDLTWQSVESGVHNFKHFH